MKAIVVTDQAAGTAGMTLVERPEPEAAGNDVLVEVHASGFTPGELAWPSNWTDRLGRDRTPAIPGHELAGVVSALGYGTAGLSVGQRVFGLADWTRDGTLADYAVVEARNLAPLPGDVDFTVGASLPISGLTAWQGLFEHGRVQAGQSVLVHGAAGGVGSMVTQLAREAGAYIIGTGRAADRQTALDFGAQEFVDLDNDALEDVGGVDLVFDVIGGDIGKRSTSLIRTGGTLVTTAGPPRSRPAAGLAIDFVVVPDRAQLSEIVQRVRNGTTADNHRQRLDPRRRRRRLQLDRAIQGEDDHPHSSVRTRGRDRTYRANPGRGRGAARPVVPGCGGRRPDRRAERGLHGRQGPRRQSTRAAHGIAHRDRSVEDWPPDRRSQDRHPLRRGDPPDTSIPPRNSEGSILGNQGTAAVSDDNARLVHREAGVVIPGRNHRDMDRGGGPLHTPSLYRNSKDSVSIGSRLSASRGRPCW
jgi:NADPH:quinone reductase-like Zn-dependent oxidoreductase